MRNLNVHSLCKSINKLCDFLDSEYSINCGGCCFIASLLATHLDKLGISYNLIAYDYLEKDLDYIQHEVSSKVKNKSCRKSVTGNHTCNHYSLFIEGAGEVNRGDFDECLKYVIKDVQSSNIRWIYRNGAWNTDYNTCNNKAIKNIVKSFFEQYEAFSIR